MKITDYTLRAAAMDTYLTGMHLTGVEVGVDVGAHAEALLTHCSIERLYLVDVWTREWCFGYAQGRLETKGWKHRTKFMKETSTAAANKLKDRSFDFVYLDQLHDYKSVSADLRIWWPLIKQGGVLGHRNYAASNTELKKAVDEFVATHKIHTEVSSYHNEIILFK